MDGTPDRQTRWVSLISLPNSSVGSDGYCGCWVWVRPKQTRGLSLCRREAKHPILFGASRGLSPFLACQKVGGNQSEPSENSAASDTWRNHDYSRRECSVPSTSSAVCVCLILRVQRGRGTQPFCSLLPPCHPEQFLIQQIFA